jgi:hypothetical protein
MAELFDGIAQRQFNKILCGAISNAHLREYFNACFQEAIDSYGAYQCWTCINCMRQGNATQGWGAPPSRCTRCRSPLVYEIATFQSRSSIVGSAFEAAFFHLIQTHYRIPLTLTPGNTRTHDFEVTGEVAIEAKGSPSKVANPNSTFTELDRPGLERSDTKKKAFDNARTYRQRNPTGLFFIVSNAVPSDLVGYRNRDVTAVFDVNKTDRIESMILEIRGKVDLPYLQRQRGWTPT